MDSLDISCSVPSSRISTPSTITVPESTSQNREIRRAIVVFPEPEGPTMAVTVPGWAWKATSTNTGLSPYPNVTLRSSTLPEPSPVRGVVGSGREGASVMSSVSASAIRPASKPTKQEPSCSSVRVNLKLIPMIAIVSSGDRAPSTARFAETIMRATMKICTTMPLSSKANVDTHSSRIRAL